VRVVIAAGGTAGHVNPALALAEALEGCEVIFLGTATGAEATLVPAAGWPLEQVEVRGWDRARPLSLVPTGLLAARAVLEARSLLRRLLPDVVVGMGGYVSLPACVAARAAPAPVVLHEQNIVFGLAHRVCKPLASAVAVSFEASLADAGPRGVWVGNPVRAEIARADRPVERARALQRFSLDGARKTLLVFGGSQGAGRINEAAFELVRLWARRPGLQIVHITGSARPSSSGSVEAPDLGDGLIYRSVPFVDRMIEAYAVADLALCRGGATTVAELAAVGLPAVIVPYPHHRDRQQERHARLMESAGAAAVVSDSEATAERIAAEAGRLLENSDRLGCMQAAAAALGAPEAAPRLATVVLEVAAQ
jgi:UDP-N-acetylglucosamine--N-acetylmuramyl-(pentapeptide) pyrophosphoryl-undecaprenol N-acetylglucosamine transferase